MSHALKSVTKNTHNHVRDFYNFGKQYRNSNSFPIGFVPLLSNSVWSCFLFLVPATRVELHTELAYTKK